MSVAFISRPLFTDPRFSAVDDHDLFRYHECSPGEDAEIIGRDGSYFSSQRDRDGYIFDHDAKEFVAEGLSDEAEIVDVLNERLWRRDEKRSAAA